MSKGSKQRPTNHDAFSGNFDKIFTGKPIRGSFIQDPETGELVPKDQYYAPSNASHYVMPDI
ncbi:MAG: hypothetical protein ACK44V_05610, partial [Burkholderiales bacterium]